MAFNRVGEYLNEAHPEKYIKADRIKDARRIRNMCIDEDIHISLIDAEVIWEKYSYDSSIAQNEEFYWRLLPSDELLHNILFGDKHDSFWPKEKGSTEG